MKKTSYTLLLCFFVSTFAFSQGKKHIATIIENKSGSIIKGLLYAVSDTDVVLTFRNISESQMKNAQVHYKFDKIDLLKIRRKNIGIISRKININKSQAKLANNKVLIKKYCIVNE